MLGNSQREYDKRILDYFIKNQLRYRDNIGFLFCEALSGEYYDSLLSYNQQRMMLYPYHLSDILVCELRITPFTSLTVPPGDIASVFYPFLDPYSSWDAKVIERHMKWMSSAGIDVVVCSWYPKEMADPEGTPWDSLMRLLNAKDKAKMKMAFHLEPYEQRTATTALCAKLLDASFDGLYTYFATDGFSHGSTMPNWPDLSAFCARNALLFVPSVGPGYNDTRVRPWNSANARGRANGEYYREHFKMAHTAKADIVSITSFNEWHEGTQIEPAMPFTAPRSNNNNGTISATANADDGTSSSFVYAKYDGGPEQYL
ncbi:hypothetical protein niasHT_025553 [Heterodera trifolii]|uniref:FAM91 N-terminal domain-containing protein n=1 Tax=Heterodera trifolii TaxID=157864 RepID=A0ABD2K8M4_9BILA